MKLIKSVTSLHSFRLISVGLTMKQEPTAKNREAQSFDAKHVARFTIMMICRGAY